jgi:simple sugar transport system substrate-binding protein
MYLYKLSGGLVSPPATDTGLTFVTKANVAPYSKPSSRYEGSTKAQKLLSRSGAISI